MEKLKEARTLKKLQQQDVAKILGISTPAYGHYETGRRKPDPETLGKLAGIFNVTVDYLLGRKVMKFDNIEPYKFDRDVVKIKIYGSVPAGMPIEMIEDIVDEEEIPAAWLKGDAQYFGTKVKGDSMLPKFEDGDTIILKQQSDCESGQYCVVSINGTESTLKKLIKRTDGITLQPLNSSHEPLVFSNKEIKDLPVTILGVVVEVRRKF